MSLCEHYPVNKVIEKSDSVNSYTEDKTNLLLQDELTWGLSYRRYKRKEKQVPIPPKKSPINIPFKLCREKQRTERKRSLASSKKSTKSKSKSEKQPSLLQKSVMTQSQYMDYLSIPRKIEEPPAPKERKQPCELEPCPPRFVQLAVPNKRRVYENWKAYHEMLPTEVIVRYEQLLHTDKNLEPREARYYYKRLDKKKRKELRKKRRARKKKQAEKEKGDQAWLREQINLTTDAIMDYIREEPLFSLNFKQLLISDGILDRLDKNGVMHKPNRKTKNHFKKTIVDVSDKLAVWMDTLTRFVDVQAIDSEEDIAPLSLSSLSDEEEEEEEGEEEEEEEEEGSQIASEFIFKEPEDRVFWDEGEEGAWGTDLAVGAGEKVEVQLSDFLGAKKDGEGELDMELLAELIEILKNSPEEFLQSFVNKKQMPNVTYADVLDMLTTLQSGELEKKRKKRPLEDVLVDWAKKNNPDKVDNKMLKEISLAAEMLGEWWLDQEEAFQKDEVKKLHAMTTPDEGKEWEKEEWGEEGEEFGEGEALEEEEALDEEGAKIIEEEEEEEGKEFKAGEEEGAEEGIEGAEEEIEGAEEGIEEGAEEEGVEGGEEIGDALQDIEEKKTPLEEVKEEEEGEGEGVEMGEGAEAMVPEGEEEGEEGEAEETEDVEGGDRETQLETGDLKEEKGELEEDLLAGLEAEGVGEIPSKAAPEEAEEEEVEGEEEEVEGEEEEMEGEEEEVPPKEEISVIYEPGMEITAAEVGKVIKGHKPSVTFEHSPDMVCCLSLKTWAVWLLEITHNAHNWTKWVHGVIRQVREFAATIRGDVVDSAGKQKVLYKQEWRDFAKEVDDMTVAWRQYSAHVRELSSSIVDNFHGKEVKCCPKCLQDHLIKNVVTAHETLHALTEAMNCASYWQRCLDEIVDKTSALSDIEGAAEKEIASDESSEDDDEAYIEDVPVKQDDEDEDDEAVYDIEEINFSSGTDETNKRTPPTRPPGSYRKF